MMDSRITSKLRDHVCSIGINRPDKRNALDGAMFDALANIMRHTQVDSNVHCVLLHGAGPHFSAGHDLAEFASLWPQEEDGAIRRCITAFAEQSKPLVAAVTGAAVGFGATMLLHADWIAAGESAVFKFPFADLGIVPEAGATALLARGRLHAAPGHHAGNRVARNARTTIGPATTGWKVMLRIA